jgi:RNA polymerase sigma factor (sigma-70 family)
MKGISRVFVAGIQLLGPPDKAKTESLLEGRHQAAVAATTPNRGPSFPWSPQQEIAPVDAALLSLAVTLSGLPDEALIGHTRARNRLLAAAARHALHTRHLPWATRHVFHVARHFRLSPEEVEEAQQETLFGLNLAVARFHPNRGRTFRSFARLVLWQRVCNRAKSAHAVAQHFAAGLDPDELSDDRFGPSPRAAATSHDPAQVVLQEERLQAFARSREELPGTEALLLDLLMEGKRHQEIAAQLGISLSEMKRRRRRLLRKMQRRLASLIERP